MHIWEFTALVAIGSFLAGLPGALTGLGGGVVLVPPELARSGGPVTFVTVEDPQRAFARVASAMKPRRVPGGIGTYVYGLTRGLSALDERRPDVTLYASRATGRPMRWSLVALFGIFPPSG